MSPSTAPPSCSLTRTARMVPLTRPQTVTACAMTLPSTCAPSPIRRSEARNSPLIRPKICAGPLHSMLPTIDIPEPMQEPVPAFVVGFRLGKGCSTTECCRCIVLPTTSAAFAAAFLSCSGTLLLNMSTSVFRRHSLRKGQSCLLAIKRELTHLLNLILGVAQYVMVLGGTSPRYDKRSWARSRMIGEGNMKPKIVTVLSLAMLSAPALADTVILHPLHCICGAQPCNHRAGD